LGKIYPTDPLLEFKIDEALGLVQDVSSKVRPSMVEENAEKKAAMRKELAEVTLPQWYTFTEKLLASNGTGFFSGNQITLADIAWYVHISYIKEGYLDGIPTTIVDSYPNLIKLYETVSNHEKIKAWNLAH
jgi:glutathione S-transferase